MGRTPHLSQTVAPSVADLRAARAARAALDRLGIGALSDQPFARLSVGERKLTRRA